LLDINLRVEVNSDKLKLYWAKLKLITIALLASSAIYGLVIFIFEYSALERTAGFEQQNVEFNLLIRNIMAALGLMTIVATVLVGNVLAKRVPKGSSRTTSTINSPIGPNLAAYFNYKIVVLAIVDSIGLYGLIIYFLTKDLHWALILIALSYVIKIIQFPTPNRFIALMEKYRQNY